MTYPASFSPTKSVGKMTKKLTSHSGKSLPPRHLAQDHLCLCHAPLATHIPSCAFLQPCCPHTEAPQPPTHRCTSSPSPFVFETCLPNQLCTPTLPPHPEAATYLSAGLFATHLGLETSCWLPHFGYWKPEGSGEEVLKDGEVGGGILAISLQLPREEESHSRKRPKIRECAVLNWMVEGGKDSG